MSEASLKAFLEKLDTDLEQSSDDYRKQKANKLAHTVTIRRSTIDNTIRDAIHTATIKGRNNKRGGFIILGLIERGYNTLLDNLINSVRSNFLELRKNSPAKAVTIVSGATSAKTIKVVLIASEKSVFDLAKKQYTEVLQTFYDAFLVILGKSLERKSPSSKTGIVKLDTAGKVFNLEHFKATSNVGSFINDTVHEALTSIYTEKDYDTLQDDLKKLGLKTYLKIEKNAKTGEIKVFLGSDRKNIIESAKERAMKKNLQEAIKKALKRIKVVNLTGSDSLLEGKRKQVLEKVMKPFTKIKGAKVTKESTKLDKAITSATKDISPVITVGKAILPNIKKRAAARRPVKRDRSSIVDLIGILSNKIENTVAKNMGAPALVYRSGDFANSVEITDVTMTPQGFPSVGYTYDKYPYQTFEPGYAQGSPQRDPRKLIDASIREIAMGLAIGRFYTRRI
jgi:hypothetical protein